MLISCLRITPWYSRSLISDAEATPTAVIQSEHKGVTTNDSPLPSAISWDKPATHRKTPPPCIRSTAERHPMAKTGIRLSGQARAVQYATEKLLAPKVPIITWEHSKWMVLHSMLLQANMAFKTCRSLTWWVVSHLNWDKLKMYSEHLRR